MKSEDYKAIEFWGTLLGSLTPYIKAQQDLAAADKAPALAIFKNDNGYWNTLDATKNTNVKAAIIARHPDLAKECGWA